MNDGPPVGDAGFTAGVRRWLLGHDRPWALTPERAVADRLKAAYPGLDRMLEAALEWHRLKAGAAVTGDLGAPAAAGLIIVGSGLRPPGLTLHAYAAEVTRPVRVVYADPGARTVDVNAEFLAARGGGRISVVTAEPSDPAAVLGSAPCRELLRSGPVSVHLVIWPARCHPDEAPGVIAGYARGLPSGSTVCLTAVTPDRDEDGNLTPRARRMTEDAGLAGSPAYAHTAADIARWIEGAGMTLAEKVRPVRTLQVAPQVPGRANAAVGIVR